MSSARREIYVAETHGSLQNFDAALVNLTGILTGDQIDLSQFNFAAETISLDVADVYASDAVTIRAEPSGDVPVQARVVDAATGILVRELTLQADGAAYVATTSLPQGLYRITASAQFQDGPVAATDVFMTVDMTLSADGAARSGQPNSQIV